MKNRYMLTLTLFLLAAFSARASDKPKKEYPERGKVVSMRTELSTRGTGVHTDSEGRVSGGEVRTNRVAVYLLLTESKEYEITGRTLTVGAEVAFRRDTKSLFILDGKTERKYSVVGERLVK